MAHRERRAGGRAAGQRRVQREQSRRRPGAPPGRGGEGSTRRETPAALPERRDEERRERPLRADRVRALVLEAYETIRGGGRVADRSLDFLLRRERGLWARERRAVAETVYDLLRSEGRLEHLLERGLGPRYRELSRQARHALLLAALEVERGTAPRQALSEGGLAPSLLPGLEACTRAEALLGELEGDATRRLAVRESLPPWMAELFLRELGEAEASALAASMNQRAPLTLRANTLKTDREGLLAALQREGIEATPGRWSPWAVHAEGRHNLFQSRAFRGGLFEIQDEGSQLLARLLAPAPGQLVVDACAGAGGKSLALAAMMQNRGRLVALDVDERRLAQLGPRARRAGIHNWESHVVPAERRAPVEKRLAGKADAALIDAPCSGLGVLRRNPDARYRLQEGDIERFARLQVEILARYAALLRPGGWLVYATCSIARQENEAVVEAALAADPSLEWVDAREHLGVDFPAELLRGKALRLFPHRHGTDGFFAALLRKRRSAA